MIVCQIWDADYPWDVRVHKFAEALTGRGHEFHIIARNRSRRPSSEIVPEGTIHRLPYIRFLGPRFNDLSSFPAFFNPRWLVAIDGLVARTCADILLCRDLPLAPSAIAIARHHRIPVVLDMAENYPAMLRDLHHWGGTRILDRVIRSPALATLVQRAVLPHLDQVIVVVEEARDWLVHLGVPSDRIAIVSNTPPRQSAGPTALGRLRPSGDLRLIYIGQLDSPVRGIDVLLDAVALCRSRTSRLVLTLVGDGRIRGQLERHAAALGLDSGTVRFLGRVQHQRALALLRGQHLGIVPHVATEHTHTTVPNKLFDYMAAGLPVLTTNARPLSRIVESVGCGLVVVSGDAESMAAGIERLRDGNLRTRLGRRGREAFMTTYHWERDADELEQCLATVCRRYGAIPRRRAGTHATYSP